MVSESVKAFVKENNIVGFAVSMIIALTIKDLISAIIGSLLVPGLNVFLISLQIKNFSKYLPGEEKIHLLHVIKPFLTFVFTFGFVYFMITQFFQSWDKK